MVLTKTRKLKLKPETTYTLQRARNNLKRPTADLQRARNDLKRPTTDLQRARNDLNDLQQSTTSKKRPEMTHNK